MSWLSEFLHSPLDYLQDEPLKALSLIAAPLAAIGAPFAFPAIGGALGIGGGAGAAAGAGAAEGAGLFGGLFGGAEAGAAGFAGGESALASILGPEAASGFGPEAFSAFAGDFPGAASGSWLPEFGVDALYAGTGAPNGLLDAGAGFDVFGPTMEQLTMGGGGLGDIGTAAASGGGGTGVETLALGDLAGGTGGITDGASGAGGAGWWDKLSKGAMDSVMKNPLGIALAGGGLAYNMAQGQRSTAEMDAMKASAQGLGAQGQQLMSYLNAGTLPPGLKTAVDNAKAGIKAKIVSNHARNGQSTDPSQNSALLQELNQVDLNVIALIAQQGQQLLTTGMNATNMSNQLYGMLENLERQKSQQTGQAIANFAAALSGPRVSVNLGRA